MAIFTKNSPSTLFATQGGLCPSQTLQLCLLRREGFVKKNINIMAIPWEEFTSRNHSIIFAFKALCKFPVTTDLKREKSLFCDLTRQHSSGFS